MQTLLAMMTKDHWLLGHIQKTKGWKGHFIVGLADPTIDLPAFDKLFVYLHHTYVPYRISSWQLMGRQACCALQGIDTYAQALKLKGCAVFLPLDIMSKTLQVATSPSSLLGYQVVDLHQGSLGSITKVYERSFQPLISVAYQGKDLLIPLHPAFIKQVDTPAQQVKVALPMDYISVLLGA